MYYADIITKDDIGNRRDNSPVVRALFNNIKSCKHASNTVTDCQAS